ncbi:MAG: hypothetical protein Q6356_010920 [Candidatus Wukongarchaeota archaeon]|nr:hypothetical protein [Candidatus Wukongarchaeota archaeon]
MKLSKETLELIKSTIEKELPENPEWIDSQELRIKISGLCATIEEDIFIEIEEE